MIGPSQGLRFGGLRFITGLLLVALLPTGAPTAWAQTPICDVAASLDPASELVASPRDSFNAEFLALGGSEGLAADSLLYELILRDLADVEALEPGITEWPLRDSETADSFFVWFETEADRDRAENGEIADYTCLNELLDLSEATYYTNVLPRTVALEFDGVYHLARARELYAQIPTVEFTEANGTNFPDVGCYYSPDGQRRVYFLERTESILFTPTIVEWARAEVSFSGAEVERVEGTGAPPWNDEREACLAGDLSGSLDFLATPVTDIPTANELGLCVFIGLLVAAALRRLRLS